MSSAKRSWSLRMSVVLALLASLAQLMLSSYASAAPIVGLSLHPVSARNEPNALGGQGVVKGAAIETFHYIVNVNNTGTTTTRSPTGPCSPLTAGYPETCGWTSIAGVPGSSPIATQGDQSDFDGGATVSLPPGRYLVSVLADGFKLDGEHFTVDSAGKVQGPLAGTGQLIVELQPTPLPDSTVRALVFQDNAPVNGAPDTPAEAGLAGFEGQLADYLGQIVTDVYGNPLCTTYVGEDPDTHAIPAQHLDADGLPVVDTPGGHCYSDADGMLAIPHMGTNRYALSVVAPDGTDWVQTTTLEGNHDWDSWVMEGNTGFDTEFVVAGEPVPTAIFGFVHPTALSGSATGEIKGVVDATKIYVPTNGGLSNAGQIFGGLNGGKIDKPIDRPWIALSDLGNSDQAVYVGRGAADGTFDITHVPDGDYTITWWDDAQNYILDLQNVTVRSGQVEDLGILPLQEWWTQFEGHVFNDLNSNGKRDPGEPGIKDFPHRDEEARELGDGPRQRRRGHRERRLLLHGERLPDDPVAGHGGLLRPLLHDRRHLPGRQPERGDHGPRRRRGHQRPADHRPVGTRQLGRQALRRQHQRRNRRHGQLRHDPQRARPALRGGRALAAGHPGPAGQPLRPGALRHAPGHPVRHHPGGRLLRAGPRRVVRARRPAQPVHDRDLDPSRRRWQRQRRRQLRSA